MEGWNSRPLAEVCQFINGLWKGEDPPFVNVGVIRNTNFTKDGTLDDSDIAYLDVEVKKFGKRRLEYGDLILEKSGGGPKQPVGRVVFFDKTQGDFSFSNFTAAIRVSDPATLYPQYLHRYLHWFYLAGNTEAMQSHSTGIRNLNGDAYKAISVTYPSFPEQRRIVAILDEAFEAIATAKANAEKSLQNARKLFEGYLETVFAAEGDGWSVNRVGEVADCCLGKMLDKVKNKGEPKPYLRNLNVRWFGFDLTDVQEMRFTKEEYDRYSVRQGDVVICEGGYPGRAAIWAEGEPIFIQKALHRVRFAEDLLGRWFLYYLYSQETSGALRQHFTGTGIQHFTGAALSRLSLPLAPQSVIAELVERFDALAEEVTRLEAVFRSKLAALEELKKSLLQRAFTGALTAKSTANELAAVA